MPRGVKADNKSKVRDKRMELGLSQAALAAAAKVNQKTVSRIERGLSKPMPEVLEALGLTKADLKVPRKKKEVPLVAAHAPADAHTPEHNPKLPHRVPMYHSHEYYQIMELLHFIDEEELAQLRSVIDRLIVK